ncbi:MAG: hypothetical protein AAFP03_18685, partial [Cyanobacteria bacterium J06598_3]
SALMTQPWESAYPQNTRLELKKLKYAFKIIDNDGVTLHNFSDLYCFQGIIHTVTTHSSPETAQNTLETTNKDQYRVATPLNEVINNR